MKTFNYDRKVTGNGSSYNPETLVRQAYSVGSAVIPNVDISMSTGTADFQFDAFYLSTITIPAGTSVSLDLVGGLTDAEGNPINFAAIKSISLWVKEADYKKSVRFGPQGEANANQLWFGGVGADSYVVITSYLTNDDPITGWPVVAGSSDVLMITNPTGVGTGDDDVTIVINILGISA